MSSAFKIHFKYFQDMCLRSHMLRLEIRVKKQSQVDVCRECSVVHVFQLVWPCFYPLTEKLTDQVMQNPQVLAALQERLDHVSHTPSSYIET